MNKHIMDSSVKTHAIDKEAAVLTGFKAATLGDIPLLKEYFNRYPSRSCDFTLGGVLIWADYFRYHIAVAADTLFIAGKSPESDTWLFYTPRGPHSLEIYRSMIADFCRSRGIEGRLLLAVETKEEESGISSVESPTIDGWREYLYDIDRFTGFAGKKMEKKRNHLNFFNSHYPEAEIREIGAGDMSELEEFSERFEERHAGCLLMHYENAETLRALRNYDAYGFLGVAIRIGGKLVGYSYGERAADAFVVHAEKGDIEYRGIYQALASAMARMAKERWPELRYLNREDDMDFEDLRRSKLSYHPSLFIEKQVIK